MTQTQKNFVQGIIHLYLPVLSDCAPRAGGPHTPLEQFKNITAPNNWIAVANSASAMSTSTMNWAKVELIRVLFREWSLTASIQFGSAFSDLFVSD